jgi:hypothetical protein
MRYSKRALLLFGAGAVLGLVVVSAHLAGLGRIASLTMAAGLALLPLALVADWWSHRPWREPRPKRKPKPKARAKARAPKRRAAPARRQPRKQR